MENDIRTINEAVRTEGVFIEEILSEVKKTIVGQKEMIERILIALLTEGHILLEGVPGLAKTLTIKTVADVLDTRFTRIQFTPDLLPADVIGSQVYNPKTQEFTSHKGPIFTNLLLADEINRAPAKVQSALLEAMQERQVTVGGVTQALPNPFMVLATQNPIEQEGTYPLPEAQVDRFMFKVVIDYPKKTEERQILNRMTGEQKPTIERRINIDRIISARKTVAQIYVDERIKDYIVDLVIATRKPGSYGLDKLAPLIAYGASPRATIFLAMAAKGHAFLMGRGYVTPEDIKSVALDILRHRVIISYEAEAEELDSVDIIRTILDKIEVP